MSWLKHAVALSASPKASIISRIKEQLGGPTPPRGYKHIHASAVTKVNFCPRHVALLDLTQKKLKDEYIPTAMAATFDVGNATSDLIREHWLGPYSIGNWECRSCGEKRTFCSKPGKGCKKLGRCNWRYEEIVFHSHYGVMGSIDMFVDLGSQKFMAVENKILKDEDFQEIVTPLAEHKQRTQLYLKLIADSYFPWKDKINLFEARVFYVSRAYGRKNVNYNNEVLPFREFVVERDDAKILPLLNNARQIKTFREEAKIPSGICMLPTDKYAKSCSTCVECFSGKYPAAQPSLE